jgi:hypothetical protein
MKEFKKLIVSRRRELNPRSPPYQGGALPLSHNGKKKPIVGALQTITIGMRAEEQNRTVVISLEG